MAVNDAITNLIVVEDKHCCPTKYTLLNTTEENEDADLWKDGYFKSKVRRYICFTKDPNASKWNHILTDIVITGMRDPIPPGYEVITETFDTKQSSLKKHQLCLKYQPRTAASVAITDILLTKHDAYKTKKYTLACEINGIRFCFKHSPVTPNYPTRAPPPVPREVTRQTVPPLQAPPVPQPRNPGTNHIAQSTNKSTPIGIQGVPFKINDKYLNSLKKENDLVINIKSITELESLSYDFTRERSFLRSGM